MMLIRRSKTSRGYLPQYDEDLELFMHCCAGSMEVYDIHQYFPVFNAHGIQVMIQDETLSTVQEGK